LNVYEKKNSELIKEFNRYVRKHPDFADDIPKNAIVVMQLESEVRGSGYTARERDRKISPLRQSKRKILKTNRHRIRAAPK
jgi:hypothetical protein